MRGFYKHITGFFLCLLAVAALSSCVMENPDTEDTSVTYGPTTQFVFRVTTLGTDVDQKTDPVEFVKSLRIIIIDRDGALEVNEKVDIPTSGTIASDFAYTFRRELKTSGKRVFLIANEESVGTVSLTETSDLPSGLPLSSLSQLLGYFTADPDDRNARLGWTFEKVLNRVYFESDFNSMTEAGRIYLPYSSFYELGEKDFGEVHLGEPLYLVPVANKIEFKFVNYRRFGARIKDITVCSLNRNNFLNAQIDDSEKTRELDGKNVWWIDWMEAIAQASRKAEDNEAFNRLWGWMETYRMPVAETLVERSLNTKGDDLWLEPLVDKNNPDKKDFGPFYITESRNMVPVLSEPDEETGLQTPTGEYRQAYTLRFNISDELEEEQLIFEGHEIDTVKTLFRGSHIVVYVELYEKALDIYAEIVPWTLEKFKGYVQQEDDD